MTICTIILAAGAGSRFGGPKALAAWRDGTLLSRAVAAAPRGSRIVVVTGAHAGRITEAAEALSVATLHNADWERGMGTSIAAGLACPAAQKADVALILPVDQPFVPDAHLAALADAAMAQGLCVLTVDGHVTGPPAAIPARCFASLPALGAGGLKAALGAHGTIPCPGALRDIDTPDDLARLRTLC